MQQHESVSQSMLKKNTYSTYIKLEVRHNQPMLLQIRIVFPCRKEERVKTGVDMKDFYGTGILFFNFSG